MTNIRKFKFFFLTLGRTETHNPTVLQVVGAGGGGDGKHAFFFKIGLITCTYDVITCNPSNRFSPIFRQIVSIRQMVCFVFS